MEVSIMYVIYYLSSMLLTKVLLKSPHGQRKEMLFRGLCGDLYSSMRLHLMH